MVNGEVFPSKPYYESERILKYFSVLTNSILIISTTCPSFTAEATRRSSKLLKIPQLVHGRIWDLTSASLADEGKKELKECRKGGKKREAQENASARHLWSNRQD